MTEIASHRGGALLWPENSRTAFENTAKLPVVKRSHPDGPDLALKAREALRGRPRAGN